MRDYRKSMSAAFLSQFMRRHGLSYRDAAMTLGVPQWRIWATMLGLLSPREACKLMRRVIECETAIQEIDYKEF
jgi:hypothetical protein